MNYNLRKGMNKMKSMMKGMSKSMKGGMTSMTNSNSTDMSTPQSGGKTRKHKVNNVLRAWRMHVQKVAKEENVSYGKEAMQMAKKGKHGQEWARIKISLKKQKGGIPPEMPAMSSGDEMPAMSSGDQMPMAPTVTDVVSADENNANMGGRRRKSRKHKRRMSRKSRKSRKH